MAKADPDRLLEVRGLTTAFDTDAGRVVPSNDLTLHVDTGEVVGLVGESGSGKSMTAKAILGLVEPRRAIRSGEIILKGTDLLQLDREGLRQRRGRDVAMIFQDPMSSLNPLMRIGTQLTRLYLQHDTSGRSRAAVRRDARERALHLLECVKIPDPVARFEQYPHQFSGGMRQRIMIAMALMCDPALLIADEPTTALDATVELQVVQLLRDLQADFGMAVLFISHNLTVISRIANRVIVMYAGQIVEEGPSEAVLSRAGHPYTQALLASIPSGRKGEGRLRPIAGEPPRLTRLPKGCPFQPRCPLAQARCATPQTLALMPGSVAPHHVACHVATGRAGSTGADRTGGGSTGADAQSAVAASRSNIAAAF